MGADACPVSEDQVRQLTLSIEVLRNGGLNSEDPKVDFNCCPGSFLNLLEILLIAETYQYLRESAGVNVIAQ